MPGISSKDMRSATIIGFATLGLLAFMSLASAATVKIAAEKESCVIRVQNAPRTLISASLRACSLKRALYLLETQHVAISGYPEQLGSSLLSQSFERLPVYEALQRIFAPYNYILYAESGRVRIEIIGMLSDDPNPPMADSTIPSPTESNNTPTSVPQALTRPSRRIGAQSIETGRLPSATPSNEDLEQRPDLRTTDDQGRELPPYVPNTVPPPYDHHIAAKGLPLTPRVPLPPFVPIKNKTGPVISGPAPKPLPAFTPVINETGPD